MKLNLMTAKSSSKNMHEYDSHLTHDQQFNNQFSSRWSNGAGRYSLFSLVLTTGQNG